MCNDSVYNTLGVAENILLDIASCCSYTKACDSSSTQPKT